MSNVAIQQSVPTGAGEMVPPALEPAYRLVRNLLLFEGIPNSEPITAMSQGGIAHRHLERDMFVLDPIGLAGGQAGARHLHRAWSDRSRGVYRRRARRAWRSQQLAHESATKEEREQESLIKPPPLARIALKNVALFMEGDLFNSGALSAARGQPIAFYTTAP